MGAAAAYSTLGWFRDPLLSSVVRLPEANVIGLVFHELAHQRLYVPGDTVFNESFATLVEEEGMVRWLQARDDQAGLCRFLDGLERERQVRGLLRQARAELAAIYASARPDAERRAAKAAQLQALGERYVRLRAGWREPPYFDGWFRGALNNASLGALAAYDQLTGTLRVILESEGGDLPAFYRRAERLGRLTAADRARVLGEISRPSERVAGARCRDAPG